MFLFLLAMAILMLGAVGALLTGARGRLSQALGVGGAVLGCVVGLVPAAGVLLSGQVESLHYTWSVPWGSFFLELDALTAFFALPTLLLGGVAAVYGRGYLEGLIGRKFLGAHWFFYNTLLVAMLLVFTARNGVLFLVAWELMTLASYFLVTLEDEVDSVREAGWTYLVASHLGTAALLALFVLLGLGCERLDFDLFAQPSAEKAGALFLLGLIGFGTKAGFVPLHVWLPEAHPAAPSHVSALMSGVMIKTGIYGLLRLLTLLGPPPLWWGGALVVIGLLSGLMGVSFALAQADLKRLLAYSSVENVGIIALGLGAGLLGLHFERPALAVLGFAGALLHVLNHALFKGLLFLGAGAVLHATHSLKLDGLGGLLKRMPWTGLTFLVGSVAICGLPPLNGFVSELLLYLGALEGELNLPASGAVSLLGVMGALALIGGLAAATFTKAFGMAFQGEPRGAAAQSAHDPRRSMRWSMALLASLCLLMGLGAPLVVMALQPVLSVATGLEPSLISPTLIKAEGPLKLLTGLSVGLLGVLGLLALLRRGLLRGREVGQTVTWDCGYAQPTVRMQYTASSYAQPLTSLIGPFLGTHRHLEAPQGLFPAQASLATHTPDVAMTHGWRPGFVRVEQLLLRVRWLQHGRVHLYILYIALTLLALLMWGLG